MIKVENVNLSFGRKVIFCNFNYTFEDGKVYSIMGPSGCGKSTLLRIICGLLDPDSGIITYNSEVVDKTNRDIFMMHQKYTNFPWKTCISNVLFPVSLHEKVTEDHVKRAMELLNRVGLGGSARQYPHELSGGMNQRLALARVLMTRPRVILMDEPLSALDPKTREQMQDLVLETHREIGNTIIMVTHDLDEAKKMGDVLIKLGG